MRRAPSRLILALAAAAGWAALAAAPAAAQSSGRGTRAGAFLRLPPGARGAAMGESLAAAGDDAYAAWYNPAGLGRLERVEAAGAHESRFEGISYDAAVIAVPLTAWTESSRLPRELGVAALSVYGLSATGVERRGLVETDAPSGTFGTSDRAYAFSYAWGPKDGGFTAGATAKFVDSTIDATRATALTYDAGALWRGTKLSLGGGVRGFGGSLRYRSVADPLPTTPFAAAAWRPSDAWLATAEADAPSDGPMSLGFGIERSWTPVKGLTTRVRGGYNTGNNDAGGLAGAGLGAGIGWKSMELDFAWTPGGVLGDALRYSILVRF